MSNTDITNTSKSKLPGLPFANSINSAIEQYKNAILGKKYELSVVFVTPKKAQQINIQTRNKDYVPNVLSFPLSETSGEIVLCLSKIKKEAPLFGDSFENFLAFLLIHGMLHLDGFDHGSIMEEQERKFVKKFKIVHEQ